MDLWKWARGRKRIRTVLDVVLREQTMKRFDSLAANRYNNLGGLAERLKAADLKSDGVLRSQGFESLTRRHFLVRQRGTQPWPRCSLLLF